MSNGSIVSPFTDLSQLFQGNRVKPGQTIYLRGGTYANVPKIQVSGVEGAPIRIMAYGGEEVVLKPAGGDRVIDITGYSYLELSNLIIDGSNVDYNGAKFTSGAHHITLRNCKIQNVPGAGRPDARAQGILITGDNTRDVLIDDVEISDIGGFNPDLEHGVYIQAGANIAVRRCHIHHIAGHGIHAYSGNDDEGTCQIEQCYIHDAQAGIGVYYGDARIINNIVSATNEGLRILYNWHKVLCAYNTVYAPRACSIGASTDGGTLEMVNSVIQATEHAVHIYGDATRPWRFALHLHHNLMQNAVYIEHGYAGGDYSEHDNIIAEFEPVNDGYRPLLGNPALNAGVALDDVTIDYDGLDRFDPPTIGALDRTDGSWFVAAPVAPATTIG